MQGEFSVEHKEHFVSATVGILAKLDVNACTGSSVVKWRMANVENHLVIARYNSPSVISYPRYQPNLYTNANFPITEPDIKLILREIKTTFSVMVLGMLN